MTQNSATQKPSNETIFGLIENERLQLAALAEGWNADQWNTPSLSEGWRVQEVVAHLTMPFKVGMGSMMLGMILNFGNFDRLADKWAKKATASTQPEEFVASLKENAAGRFTPPGMGPEVPLTDLVVHGLDIRIPLGLPISDIDDAAVLATLNELTTKRAKNFGVPKGIFEGRRFEATDVDWAHGEGAVERATGSELIAHLARAQPLPKS